MHEARQPAATMIFPATKAQRAPPTPAMEMHRPTTVPIFRSNHRLIRLGNMSAIRTTPEHPWRIPTR